LETLAHLKAARSSKAETRAAKINRAAPQNTPLSPLVVSIVTDFEAHALWMDAGVDLYCVAAEETKARLVARGASSENVIATGIPISARFAISPDVNSTRKSLGLRDDLPTLLVLSGGLGMGPVAEILRELGKVPRQLQIVV